jgi:hypothetical protein
VTLLLVKIYSIKIKRDNTASALRILIQSISGGILELIIVIVLVLLLFGSFPVFPYSRDWGYRGSGVLGTILLIVVILWLLHIV